MSNFIEYLKLQHIKFSLPDSIGVIDIVQILIIAILVYYIMVWVQSTRAYTLLKGILFVVFFMIIAVVLKMNTILWIFKQLSVVLITCIIVIFQPELRKALEQLGEKGMLSSLLPFESSKSVEER